MVGWIYRGAVSAITLAALSSIGIGGCTNGKLSTHGAGVDGGGMPLITVAPLEPTRVSATDNLVVTTTQTDTGYDVVVTAGEELPVVKALFARIDLGGPNFSADTFALPPTASGHVIGGAYPGDPGQVDLGLVPVGDSGNPVIQAGETLLTFKVTPITGAKSVSSAKSNHTVTTRARNLDLAKSGDTWELSWDYTNPGDTNQDGEVGVQDLQEIGRHFHEVLKNSWDDPLRHVDADTNGEINLADISSIGNNLKDVLWAYNIEMSQSGEEPFNTVGQLVLDDARSATTSGDTIRFTYQFVGQYVVGAWYRVVPLVNNPDGGVLAGTPSEAISENGRLLAGIPCAAGDNRTVTVNVSHLPAPMTHMNACRVVFPAGFDYVPNSFNAGAAGGSRNTPDGIWGTFADGLLLGPDTWLTPIDLGNGTKAIDFNVTTLPGTLKAAPVGYGDLFSFQLKSTDGSPLSLHFELGEPGGVKRTYYSEDDGNGKSSDHLFGNSIGFKVN